MLIKEKRSGPLLRPGQRGAVGRQVIATARPFCFFWGYAKRSSLSGNEETK